MRSRDTRLALPVVGVLLLAGGGAGCGVPPPPATKTPTLTQDVAPLFQASCGFGASCHGTAQPAGLVRLTLDADYDAAALLARLKGKSTREPSLALVNPGDTASSFLWHKVTGDFTGLPCAASSCGERMPQRSTPLAAEDLALLQQWIQQGAPLD